MRYEDIRSDLVEAVLRHVEKHEDPRDDLVQLVLENASVQKLMRRASTPAEWADVGAIAFLVHNVAPGISWGLGRQAADWRQNPELCGLCKAGRSHVAASYGGIPQALVTFVAEHKPEDPDVKAGMGVIRQEIEAHRLMQLAKRSGPYVLKLRPELPEYLKGREPDIVIDFDELTPAAEVVQQHFDAQVSTATGLRPEEAKSIHDSGNAS